MTHHPRFIAFFIILIVLAAVSATGWMMVQPQPRFIQGEVESRKVNVSAKIPGRIEQFLAEEGQAVSQGDVIAVLDSPQLQAKRTQAQSAQNAASAQRDKAENGAREEQVRMAQNQWLQASAGAELAEKSYRRVQTLFEDGVLPAQRRDEVQAQRDMAHKIEAAAKAQYDMAQNGARTEDKTAAQALVDQAAGAVSEVDSLIDEAKVRVPIGGEIVEHVVNLGELASAGMPIVTMVNLTDVWVTFNLREDHLASLKIGDHLKGTIPALNRQPVDLEISYIAPLGDFATWRATSIAGGFDLKTFEVRGKPAAPVEGLRPGMSVIVPWDKEPRPDPLKWARDLLARR